MFYKVIPKSLRDKYGKKVLEKAIEKTEYDLNKQNLSSDDISQKKKEAMVARNVEVIKAAHKEKGWKYAANLTGLSVIANVWKRGISGLWGGGGDDDEDLDV
jgi:hypothetical protein|tara:strand:- start:359 stop:664 length:306 start_codon:yes stop_codon:yes gene_type:complete